MKRDLRAAIDKAFLSARPTLETRSPQRAYPWLEMAHILTQRLPLPHAYSHRLMLQAGWGERDYQEVRGEVPRIFAALLSSKIWVVLGNTGRARISAFQAMLVEEELKQLLRDSK